MVADKLRDDPDRILELARKNLERWLARDGFATGPERRAILEWKDILEDASLAEIGSLITAETDEGQRLRSSSPFAGVLSERERSISWNECAEIGLD